MEPARSVLYLDFDNVFSGLVTLDPKLAMRFAEDPQIWLTGLANAYEAETRRWLVLRCYMNPSGSIPHPTDEGTRLYFSRFRPFFTDAGFEVVDCPRLSHTKNGADIRLVIDAVEALRADVRYDEFVIASGDSDMTPLIIRLRASDRRVTLLSPSDSAVVLGAVADRLIGGDDLLDLLDPAAAQSDADARDAASDLLAVEEAGTAGTTDALTEAEASKRFAEIVGDQYRAATEPINLATLAGSLQRELGTVSTASRWFGHGGFARALQTLGLPGLRMSQHYMWDDTRHTPPVETDAPMSALSMPEPVTGVTRTLKLPRLSTESWSQVYDALADFAAAYDFNLTEATRWCRDRLMQADVAVSRRAVGVVIAGAAYGGCPVYRDPPPRADELAVAFVANVLNRAAAADIELPPEDELAVR